MTLFEKDEINVTKKIKGQKWVKYIFEWYINEVYIKNIIECSMI